MIALGAIYAHCPGGGIGYKGKIHWKFPADITHFWETIGSVPVIVGYTTWKGMQKFFRKHRSDCLHVVLTRRASELVDDAPFVRFVDSKEKALEVLSSEKAAWVCGGSSIYKLFMDDCDVFVGTKIPKIYQCDSFLPWNSERPPSTTLICSKMLPASSADSLPCAVSYLASHASLFSDDFAEKLQALHLDHLLFERTTWH